MAKTPGPSKGPIDYAKVAPEAFSRRVRKENLQGTQPPKAPKSNAVAVQKANAKG